MASGSDSDSGNFPERRKQLALLCRRKDQRTAEFSRGRPTHWAPGSVVQPGIGMPFTQTGAWEFVACCLEDGVPLTEVDLEVPAGKKGYTMLVDLEDGQQLYIKLQLGDHGKVIGRSFHLSEV